MECFVIYANEIEGRLDPSYYTSEYVQLNKLLKNCEHKLERLQNLLNELYRYPTFYNIDFKKEGILCIKTTNITKEGLLKDLDSEEYDYIGKEVSERFPRTILQENDLVLTVRGATIGKIALITKEFVGSNINPNLIRISLKKEKIIPYYFWIYFNSNIGQKLFLKEVANTAKQTITVPQIKELLIPIPPIEMQETIVDLIKEAYAHKKSKESEAHKLLNSINDYVLDELGIELPELKDRMTYVVNSDEVQNSRCDAYSYQPKFEKVEKAIKKGKFEVKELKESFKDEKFIKGLLPSEEQKDGEVKVLQIRNILRNGLIDISDYATAKEIFKPEHKIMKEDVIIVITGATIGKVGLWTSSNVFYLGGDMIKFQANESFNPYFIQAFLLSEVGQYQIIKEITGATNKHLSPSDVERIKISLPTLTVQNKIAEEVKARMQKAEQLQKEAKEELEKAKKEVEKIILGENT